MEFSEFFKKGDDPLAGRADDGGGEHQTGLRDSDRPAGEKAPVASLIASARKAEPAGDPHRQFNLSTVLDEFDSVVQAKVDRHEMHLPQHPFLGFSGMRENLRRVALHSVYRRGKIVGAG